MAKRNKDKTFNMFSDNPTDMPLFSRTPVKIQIKEFKPVVEQQPVLLAVNCRVCMDTGLVIVKAGKQAVQCICKTSSSNGDK